MKPAEQQPVIPVVSPDGRGGFLGYPGHLVVFGPRGEIAFPPPAHPAYIGVSERVDARGDKPLLILKLIELTERQRIAYIAGGLRLSDLGIELDGNQVALWIGRETVQADNSGASIDPIGWRLRKSRLRVPVPSSTLAQTVELSPDDRRRVAARQAIVDAESDRRRMPCCSRNEVVVYQSKPE